MLGILAGKRMRADRRRTSIKKAQIWPDSLKRRPRASLSKTVYRLMNSRYNVTNFYLSKLNRVAGAIGQKAEKEEGKSIYSVGGEGKKTISRLAWNDFFINSDERNGE